MLFLVGSALCGLAEGMTRLVRVPRHRGLGGGGLLVGAQATIGDVVSPRGAGRYLGLFGAVFGVASVASPLIGGFCYPPVGAGSSTSTSLKAAGAGRPGCPALRPWRTGLRIDYLGTALLGVSLASLVLLTTLEWHQLRLGLCVHRRPRRAVGAGARGFVVVERAAEHRSSRPFFSNRVFLVTSAIGFVVGFALFGALTCCRCSAGRPRARPTESGLQLVPLMVGVLTASITSGLITRTVRYQVFPIVGTAVAAIGLRSCQSRRTPRHGGGRLFMPILGLGLGSVAQVLVLAVQNGAVCATRRGDLVAPRCSARSAARSARRSLRDLLQPARG